MEVLTFNDLPVKIAEISKKLDLLLERQPPEKPGQQGKARINIKKAAAYLGVTPNALRIAVHRGQIPYYKLRNRLYFDCGELDSWFAAGRVKTKEQMQAEALGQLKQKRG